MSPASLRAQPYLYVKFIMHFLFKCTSYAYMVQPHSSNFKNKIKYIKVGKKLITQVMNSLLIKLDMCNIFILFHMFMLCLSIYVT